MDNISLHVPLCKMSGCPSNNWFCSNSFLKSFSTQLFSERLCGCWMLKVIVVVGAAVSASDIRVSLGRLHMGGDLSPHMGDKCRGTKR